MSVCPASTRTPSKVQAKVETRAHMLAVARAMFATLAYDAVTLRAVAAACGATSGELFAHWKNKDELFIEAVGRPHLSDARGAEVLAVLMAVAPAEAEALLERWGA